MSRYNIIQNGQPYMFFIENSKIYRTIEKAIETFQRMKIFSYTVNTGNFKRLPKTINMMQFYKSILQIENKMHRVSGLIFRSGKYLKESSFTDSPIIYIFVL